jgi:probable rRNA maturation factor
MTDGPIDIEIEDQAWIQALETVGAVVECAALAALAMPAGRTSTRRNVVILLASDDAVRELNASYRGQDKATNVLSFPAPPNPAGHLGDIALAYGVCATEARTQGKPLADHLSHLVAHGVLHLLGYDHETDGDAEVMEDLERAILTPLGIPDPYADER